MKNPIGLAAQVVLSVAALCLSSQSAYAVIPNPGANFQGYANFSDGGRGAYTGVYQRRPDVQPPVGLPSNGGSFNPVYYTQWVEITDPAWDWTEVGSAWINSGASGGHYWFWGYGSGGVWTELGRQWDFSPSSSRYFQVWRVANVWHWVIDTEKTTMPWNAVGIRAEAGLESYQSTVGTDYLTHDTMNVTLSDGSWIGFSGYAYVAGQNSNRMCSQYLAPNSFKEKEFAPGTSC